MFFSSENAKQVLNYVKDKYGTEPEFLWAKFPGNAVLRHANNKKWYGALLHIPKQKLEIADEGSIDILNLKCDPILKSSLVDKKRYFSGYHMNKEHWITVVLNETIQIKDIYHLIDLSYDITKK